MSTSTVLDRPTTQPGPTSSRLAAPSRSTRMAPGRGRTPGSAGTSGLTGPGGRGATPKRTSPRTRPGLRLAPFVVAVCLLLAAGLVGLLLLNTVLAQDAFVIQNLQTQQARNAEKENALAEQLSARNAPQEVARRAQAQGLVPDPNAPCFVWVNQARVCTDPGQPAPGGDIPSATTSSARP